MLDMGLVRVRVFPTRVGMNRGRASRRCVRRSVPHARGDEPLCLHAPNEKLSVFPHARGDEPLALALKAAASRCSPTRVGMNRIRSVQARSRGCVPHARGDEPPYLCRLSGGNKCSPTRVGMNRAKIGPWTRLNGVPHARGDEPNLAIGAAILGACSPTRVGMNRLAACFPVVK